MNRYPSTHFWQGKEFPFFIMSYRIQPGEEVPLHTHEFMELVFIAKGKGYHEYKGKTSEILEGDVFVIEPELAHGYRVEDFEEPLIVYNLLFHPALLSQELKAMTQFESFVDFFFLLPFLRRSTDIDYYMRLISLEKLEVEMLIKRISEEFEGRGLGYQIRVKAQFIDLLVLLSRLYDRREHFQMDTAAADDRQVIENIRRFIETHCAQEFSLHHISRFCGMSQSSFISKFKKYTGKTFVEFRNEKRIELAKKLLSSSSLSITDISMEVGYSSFSHFDKAFKKLTGSSPKDYRKSSKQM